MALKNTWKIEGELSSIYIFKYIYLGYFEKRLAPFKKSKD